MTLCEGDFAWRFCGWTFYAGFADVQNFAGNELTSETWALKLPMDMFVFQDPRRPYPWHACAVGDVCPAAFANACGIGLSAGCAGTVWVGITPRCQDGFLSVHGASPISGVAYVMVSSLCQDSA